MFKRLVVQNFLSLKSIDMELGKVNVLVGPNASGKSNIARALQLTAKYARGGSLALEGYKSLRDLSFNFDPMIDILIVLEMPVGITDYAYTLNLTSVKHREQILKGNDTVISREDMISMLTTLPPNLEKEIYHLASSLKNISVHSFSSEKLRLRNNVSTQPSLDYYGGNLARYLLHLYTERRKDFGRVEETLRGMIPEIEEIIPHIEGTDVEIWIKVKDMDEPLKPHNISDGTLRLLAMIAALYSGFSLVVLEEPENCIHPYLLETFMHLVRDSPSQVLITTHSPYLLDHVKPEEIYVVWKEGLETKVKKLSAGKEMMQVKRFLEEGGTLGEAWFSGIFGGKP